MSVADRQQRLIDDFEIIENRQERLAAIVAHAKKRPPLPASDRIEANRVLGCISAVWLVASLVDGRLQLRYDADSPLVKGLTGLLIELYDGATPADIIATEPVVIEALDLMKDLSPTRQNGLIAVRRRIRELAEGLR